MSPCNDIDVYLHPLSNELKEFWAEAVNTYATHIYTNFVYVQYCYGPSVFFLQVNVVMWGLLNWRRGAYVLNYCIGGRICGDII